MEKKEAAEYLLRRERVQTRMHRAHTARMAKAMASHWPTHAFVTRQDVIAISLFAAGMAGISSYWLAQPAPQVEQVAAKAVACTVPVEEVPLKELEVTAPQLQVPDVPLVQAAQISPVSTGPGNNEQDAALTAAASAASASAAVAVAAVRFPIGAVERLQVLEDALRGNAGALQPEIVECDDFLAFAC
jgi:hypothetical protein